MFVYVCVIDKRCRSGVLGKAVDPVRALLMRSGSGIKTSRGGSILNL